MSARQASISRSTRARWSVSAGYARFALLLLALLAALPSAPAFVRAPGAVSGDVLAVGSEMLRGRVLYRDVWTNDPPLGSALTALGLTLDGSSRWGVWALELLSILVAALLLYEVLKRFFGLFPALIGAAGLLANLVFVYQGSSAVESFALPLQAGAYFLLAGIARDVRPLWRSLVLGLLLGLLISLRLEMFGVALTVGALLGMALFTRTPRTLLHLLLMSAGVLLICAGWAVYFTAQDAFLALLDQLFRYTFFYSGVTNLTRLNTLGGGLQSLYWASGFFALGALSWLVIIPYLFFNARRFRELLCARWMGAVPLAVGLLLLFNGLWDDRTGSIYDFSALSSYRLALIAAGVLCAAAALPFLAGWAARWGGALSRRYPAQEGLPTLAFPLTLALVDLPVQLVFSSLIGREAHFVSVLPSLAVLTAFLVWSLRAGRGLSGSRQNVTVWLALLALPVLITGLFVTADRLRVSQDENILRVASEIRATTRPDQTILQWGENPQLYFLSGRPSASRFLQQQPLFRPGYATAERVQSLLEDLYATPPVILVDTRAADMPLLMQDCENLQYDDFVAQTVRAERDARFPLLREEPLPYYPPEMKAVYRWLCENYEPLPSTSDAPDAWRLYRQHPGKP